MRRMACDNGDNGDSEPSLPLVQAEVNADQALHVADGGYGAKEDPATERDRRRRSWSRRVRWWDEALAEKWEVTMFKNSETFPELGLYSVSRTADGRWRVTYSEGMYDPVRVVGRYRSIQSMADAGLPPSVVAEAVVAEMLER